MELSKTDTGESRNIYIGTCYASPPKTYKSSGSTLEDNVKHKVLETFFEEADMFKDKGDVIIQGDLNARTGTKADYITGDKYDHILGIENTKSNIPRNSEDRHVCERGALLLDLCKSLDFHIVNGRKPGDIFGKFTSHQWNGSSVVDYVIT